MPLCSLGMDRNEDARSLVTAVGQFAQKELFPLDRQWDMDESSVAEALGKLGDMGLLNLLISESNGGLGCDYCTYTSIIHELAMWSPSAAVTVSVHNMVGGIVEKFAAPALRDGLISHWGKPENFGAFLVSEANAGSDAGGIQTTSARTKEGYLLNGEKMWVTNGMAARWFFVLSRLDHARGPLCAMLVDGASAGIVRDKIHGKMGIRGSETAVVHFNDVFVPAEHLLGNEGKGKAVALATLNRGRIGIAAQATGIGEACLTEMVSYSKTREQFGRAIGRFQAIGNMIADSAVELEAAKCLTLRAAELVDAGRECRMAASMAKLSASETANRIAYRAVQAHGGTGYVRECRVEQLFRDARITTIYEGTSEIQRIVIARQLANA